jgi:hypothetical protein
MQNQVLGVDHLHMPEPGRERLRPAIPNVDRPDAIR